MLHQPTLTWRASVVLLLIACLHLASSLPSDLEREGAGSNCTFIDKCDVCASSEQCMWCTSSSTCRFGSSYAYENCTSLCSGDSCKNVCTTPETCEGIFPCSSNVIGQILLIAFYGIILGFGAKTISDGSELMLELFPKWGTVIGALLLPILGAIPDAAIILVSGAFGSVEEAQVQVGVGMGTLAGSTIMLLTVPWAGSLWVSRCDFDDVGEMKEGKCTKTSLTGQGTEVDQDTATNAKIMLVSSLFYFIVQGVAFAYLYDPSGASAKKLESPFALAGFIFCTVSLFAYCVYQVFVPKLAAKRQARAEKDREERALQLRALHVLHAMQSIKKKPVVETVEEVKPELTPDQKDAHALNMGLKWKKKVAAKKLEEAAEPLLEAKVNIQGEPEEEEEDKNFGRDLAKGIALMVFGTLLVAFFSDPMVGVITDFSKTIHIGAFYVSFLLTPYCSNASELISSLVFAAGKKKENSSLTFSQLYGAATMNNTLGLGIFFALVFFRDLAWEFTAETLSILLVTWIVGFIGAFRTKFQLFWAIPVLSLYPLSLFFVWFLETVVKWA